MLFTPSVTQVETAIPAFIGYTEKGPTNEPAKIKSMTEYRSIFGGPANELPGFTIDSSGSLTTQPSEITGTPIYKMFYMLRMFFANRGGACYITSVGKYKYDEFTSPPNGFCK